MAKETTKKPKDVIVEDTKTSTSSKSKSEKQITRMVVEVPTESVQSFKVLCDLTGSTQGLLVAKALNKYIADNQALVDQFIALRTQVGNTFKD